MLAAAYLDDAMTGRVWDDNYWKGKVYQLKALRGKIKPKLTCYSAFWYDPNMSKVDMSFQS